MGQREGVEGVKSPFSARSENECFADVHIEVLVFLPHCPPARIFSTSCFGFIGGTLVSAFNILFVSLSVPPEDSDPIEYSYCQGRKACSLAVTVIFFKTVSLCSPVTPT